MSNISRMLYIDEGYRAKPYRDSEGYPTVGIGIKIGPKGGSLGVYTFSVPLKTALLWVDEYSASVVTQLSSSAALRGVWPALNDARRDALVNMGYQMGADGSTQGIWKFKRMIAAVAAQDWQEAHKQALDSLWARQTPDRAERVAATLRDGNYRAYERLAQWQQSL